jgi:hypothetical protein
LKTFGAAFDFELDLIAFFEVFVPIACDGFKVDKNIFSAITCDEAETFSSVEPFDCSFFHGTILSLLR